MAEMVRDRSDEERVFLSVQHRDARRDEKNMVGVVCGDTLTTGEMMICRCSVGGGGKN